MFICMDCYEGETLRDKIARGPLPVEKAALNVRHMASIVASSRTCLYQEVCVRRGISNVNCHNCNDDNDARCSITNSGGRSS